MLQSTGSQRVRHDWATELNSARECACMWRCLLREHGSSWNWGTGHSQSSGKTWGSADPEPLEDQCHSLSLAPGLAWAQWGWGLMGSSFPRTRWANFLDKPWTVMIQSTHDTLRNFIAWVPNNPGRKRTHSWISCQFVTKPKLILLPSQLANTSRGTVLGQRIATLLGKPADWEHGGLVSQGWRKQWHPDSSTLAWKIPWTEEPGRLQSMGSLGVGHDWATSLSLSCIGEGNGSPLQCSCLENPRDGRAWWAAVSGVTQSRTRLKRFSKSSSSVPRNHLSQNSHFFYTKGERVWLIVAEFLILESFVLAAVHVGLVTMFL